MSLEEIAWAWAEAYEHPFGDVKQMSEPMTDDYIDSVMVQVRHAQSQGRAGLAEMLEKCVAEIGRLKAKIHSYEKYTKDCDCQECRQPLPKGESGTAAPKPAPMPTCSYPRCVFEATRTLRSRIGTSDGLCVLHANELQYLAEMLTGVKPGVIAKEKSDAAV